MEHFKNTVCTVVMVVLIGAVQAQSVAVASGGEAEGAGGTLSYTLGQTAYTYLSSSTGSLSQGIQQPYQIIVAEEELTSTKVLPQISVAVQAYPNPTHGRLILKLAHLPETSLSFQLYDLSGSLVQNGTIENEQTPIEMQNLPNATYFIRVTDGLSIIKSFKIIKY